MQMASADPGHLGKKKVDMFYGDHHEFGYFFSFASDVHINKTFLQQKKEEESPPLFLKVSKQLGQKKNLIIKINGRTTHTKKGRVTNDVTQHPENFFFLENIKKNII